MTGPLTDPREATALGMVLAVTAPSWEEQVLGAALTAFAGGRLTPPEVKQSVALAAEVLKRLEDSQPGGEADWSLLGERDRAHALQAAQAALEEAGLLGEVMELALRRRPPRGAGQ